MVELEKPGFDAAAFLAHAGLGRRIVQLPPRDTFFSQGDPADSIFYLQKGRAKVTVVSAAGKEATITLLADGDFVEKRRWRPRRDCVCPRPLPLPPAPLSKSAG